MPLPNKRRKLTRNGAAEITHVPALRVRVSHQQRRFLFIFSVPCLQTVSLCASFVLLLFRSTSTLDLDSRLLLAWSERRNAVHYSDSRMAAYRLPPVVLDSAFCTSKAETLPAARIRGIGTRLLKQVTGVKSPLQSFAFSLRHLSPSPVPPLPPPIPAFSLCN